MTLGISSNYQPRADVILLKPGGRALPFGPSPSNAARGAALLAAMQAATAGDTILLHAGTFDLGDVATQLPDDVCICGQGMFATILTLAAESGIELGSRQSWSSLAIVAAAGNCLGDGGSAKTGLRLSNVRLSATGSGANALDLGSVSEVRAFGCDITGANHGILVHGTGASLHVFGSRIQDIDGTAAVAVSDGACFLFACNIEGTTVDLQQSGGTLGVSGACRCDGAALATSGTITFLDHVTSVLATLTTKGDMIVHNGTANARLPVGADNFVLTADASSDRGVKWAAPTSDVMNQYDATEDPTATDDNVSGGFSVGSRWINGTNHHWWVCLDATEGAAVWLRDDRELDGSSTEIQFNNAGQLAGSSLFTWNTETRMLSLGLWDSTSTTENKCIVFQPGGFTGPGAFSNPSTGDKLVLFRTSAENSHRYDATIGVDESSLWLKSVDGLGGGTIELWVADDTSQGFEFSDVGLTFSDGRNLVVAAAGTGSQIATAANQLLAFWGQTPIAQPASADQEAVTLGNVDDAIGTLTFSDPPTGAEVEALRDLCEELADDVRALATLVHALRSGAVAAGLIKGSA